MNRTEINSKQFESIGLNAWVRASNYCGEDLIGWFSVLSVTRDSGIQERSNWKAALERMNYKKDNQNIRVVRFSHWGCGYFEVLMVSRSAAKKTAKKVVKIVKDLQNYPILDDDIYYEMELQEQEENFDSFDKGNLLDLLSENLVSFDKENVTEAQENCLFDIYRACMSYSGELNDESVEYVINDDKEFKSIFSTSH